jgi:hypothetical protein
MLPIPGIAQEDAVEYGRSEAQLSVPALLPLAQGSDLGWW